MTLYLHHCGYGTIMRVKVAFINDYNSTVESKLADLTFIIEEPRPSFLTPARIKLF
jgi:hypothetical protein